ncbi:variant erythrocyte surface antigen-1 family protein [Babesia caballi]|uniref:Variant erythrocyte surface antigen-1 family protein n=1 Tax=Babesia caballi TaxID=5871 RepID=A0AAV4LRF3_BABCB|nr:variant erythrocyte surface antigen-1 family protein [Babesia caballi]
MGADDFLKTPPDNLKDAIDWILWFLGYGGNGLKTENYTKLAKTLKENLEFKDAKNKAFGNTDPAGVINMLAKGLAGFLGYVSQGESPNFSGDSGIIKNNMGYTSEYQDADWEHNNDTNYAMIFLGAASMMFYGLSFLYWKCKVSHGDGWSNSQLNDDGGWGLGRFMRDMGFNPSRELRDVKGSKVATILDSEGAHNFDELQKAYGNGQYVYSNFVDELETQYNPQNNALNSPLTSCYKFAKHYFTSKFKERDSESIDQTLTAIKKSLEGFSKLCTTSAQDLQYRVGGFLKEAMPDPASSQLADTSDTAHSSPAGPVAGTLTTLGIGGGAAAAYMLNLGGAKTLVNGLLKIG